VQYTAAGGWQHTCRRVARAAGKQAAVLFGLIGTKVVVQGRLDAFEG
jgi:hypothetical protein